MGLNEGGNATYIGISEGRIALKVKEGFPGAEKVVNRETGAVSWVKYYSSVDGHLIKIESKQDKFNERCYNWHLTIKDGDVNYILQVRENSGYGRSLMNSLPNVNFSKIITFSPYMKVVSDKKKGTLYLSQEGKNIEWFFTRETPNGLPELKVNVDARGNKTYDDSEMMIFYQNYVEDIIKPRISEANQRRDSNLGFIEAVSEKPETFSDGSPIPNEEEPDLPF